MWYPFRRDGLVKTVYLLFFRHTDATADRFEILTMTTVATTDKATRRGRRWLELELGRQSSSILGHRVLCYPGQGNLGEGFEIPPTPWTAKTSRESSIFRVFYNPAHVIADKASQDLDDEGTCNAPDAGVMVARPQSCR